MVAADVVYLITQDTAAHGVFDTPTETQRMVQCTVRSVGMTEVYTARSIGLQPTMRFVLANKADYEGERALIWDGNRYEIIRTYTNPATEEIELTVQEVGNS